MSSGFEKLEVVTDASISSAEFEDAFYPRGLIVNPCQAYVMKLFLLCK